MNDLLGKRMKDQYEVRTKLLLPRRTYTLIRIDGKAFHSFTKGMNRPFDQTLMDVMDKTTLALCENIQGCKMGFVQSDEISLILTDFDDISTNAWFDGNVQKITSISASMATAYFNKYKEEYKLSDKMALFDSRVWTIPDIEEVVNYFIWRQKDATRNSINMTAQSLYSFKELQKKNCNEMQEMIFQKGINWNNYTSREKRGGVCLRAPKETSTIIRDKWTLGDCPIFTQERDFIKNIITPKTKEESHA